MMKTCNLRDLWAWLFKGMPGLLCVLFGVFAARAATLPGCPPNGLATHPQIIVMAACPVTPVLAGGSLTYQGTVRNPGDITLTNVVVTSDRPAPNTIVFAVAALAPGASATFTVTYPVSEVITGSYTFPDDSCFFTTTFQGTGKDLCTLATVTNRVSTTCTITRAPAVILTLVCPPSPIPAGQLVTYTGTVRNSGNAILNDVLVVDNQGVPTTVQAISRLLPGGSASFTVTFRAPYDACAVTSMVTVTGTEDCTGLRITNTAPATCALITAPAIALIQNCPITLVSVGGVFIYTGSVTNPGNITLTNVFVFSNQPTNQTVLLGPITLPPWTGTNFVGQYVVAGVTNLSTNTFSSVATNTVTVFTTNLVLLTVTNSAPTLITNQTINIIPNIVTVTVTNQAGTPVTNHTTTITPASVTLLVTNIAGSIITNQLLTVITNVLSQTVTNLTGSISTNLTFNIITNSISTAVTNQVGTVITNQLLTVITNVLNLTVTNNTATIITNNSVQVTTNVVSVTVTNNSGSATVTNTTITITTNASGGLSFGTINSLSRAVVDRFSVPNNLNGLTYAGEDHGYGATQFYSTRKDNSGSSFFETITASTGNVADRFNASNRTFDALAYAAPDLGFGPVIFYYLSHDNAGVSSFGTITPGGVVGVTADHFVVGSNFDALTFSATDVGYGANLFYYIRHDAAGVSFFGTINPALPGTITDRFTVGSGIEALVFTDLAAPGFGPNNFYYLRRDPSGQTTFGTIFVTGLTTATVTDRFPVGPGAFELTFTATDAGSFGPNLFYFLRRESGTLSTNTVTSITTNSVPVITTNSVPVFTTNTVTTLTTNQVPVITTNSVPIFTTNSVTTLITNNVPLITTNTVTSFTTNTVSTLVTNNVPTITTNSVTSFVTNSVISLTTNNVPVITTNTVTTFTTNIVATVSTNFLPVIVTNSVTTFVTNTIATITTNIILTVTTNVLATVTSNTVPTLVTNIVTTIVSDLIPQRTTNIVTARGVDICLARVVTATAFCSGLVQPTEFDLGGPPLTTYQDGTFSLSFATQLGDSFTVQYKDSLSEPFWTDLPNMPIMGTGGIITITDVSADTQHVRFYRVINP
jgi:hypothetical protein